MESRSQSSSRDAFQWVGLVLALLGLMIVANLTLVVVSQQDGGAQALYNAQEEDQVLGHRVIETSGRARSPLGTTRLGGR